jgi:hypothetical protein
MVGVEGDGGWLGKGVNGFYRWGIGDEGVGRRKYSKKNIKIFAPYLFSCVLYTRNNG